MRKKAFSGPRLGISAIIIATIFLQACGSGETEAIPTYELSNQITDQISINRDNSGAELVTADLMTISDQIVSTQDLVGRPLIINIWYSTCEPCRRELPVLEKAHRRYQDIVQFVGLNIKDSTHQATEFAEAYDISYEIFFDRNGEFITAAGITTTPVTLAVDLNGTVVRQFAGELNPTELDALVASILP